MSILDRLIGSFSSYGLLLTMDKFFHKFIIVGYRNYLVYSVENIIKSKPILNVLLNWCYFDGQYAIVEDDYLNDVVYFFNNKTEKKLYLIVSKEVTNYIKKKPKKHELEFAEVTIEEDPGIEVNITKREYIDLFKASSFITGAKRFEYVEGKRAEFIFFNMYYPNYDSMSKKQREFYLYFRSELKKGNFLNTDLSYVFLYIYERINKLEWTNADDVLQSIFNVWLFYRKQYPNLDGYLIHWCFDFIALNSPKMTIFQFAEFIYEKNIKPIPIINDLIINNVIRNKQNKFKLKELEILSNYKISKSKFYQSTDKVLIEKSIGDIFTLTNKYSLKMNKKSILDMFSPKTLRGKIKAYSNAIYELDPKEYEISYTIFSNNEPLKAFITNMLRYSENALRYENSYKSKLKNVELSDEYSKLIDEYFLRKVNKITKEVAISSININMENVKTLKQESEEILTILAVKNEEDFEEETVETKDDIITIIKNVPNSYYEFNFIKDMEISQREVLCAILNGSHKEINQIATKYCTMSDILVDEINNLSLQNIGDILINTSISPLSINEEYELILREIFEKGEI